jgi:hypothetical protein
MHIALQQAPGSDKMQTDPDGLQHVLVKRLQLCIGAQQIPLQMVCPDGQHDPFTHCPDGQQIPLQMVCPDGQFICPEI